MDDVYIVSACRTPIGNLNGQLSHLSAVKLGTYVIEAALLRANMPPKDVSEVIMGQVLTAGQGQNPARQAAAFANVPFSVPAYVVNMICGSGLKAVHLGYLAIRNGDASVVVAGGQESMSMAQHAAFLRSPKKVGGVTFMDTILSDGLVDAFHSVHMGKTAENLAVKYAVSREFQDRYATVSQNRAEAALANDYFEDEIVPIPHPKFNNKDIRTDEFIKKGTTLDRLQRLKPAFENNPDLNPSVTAGNSSGINDGAAALVLVSKKELEKRKIQPLGKIVGFAESGIDPMSMGLGPVEAIDKLLDKVGWTKDEVDLYEINEAFAVQSIIVMDKLGLDVEKVNVSGGAIALGHPIGCSGARILVTLLYNMKRLSKDKGVAALCIGGGMGIAIAVERPLVCN